MDDGELHELSSMHDPGEQLHQYGTGQDEATKIKTEFKNRIQIARQEIQTKFGGYFDELRKEETRLLEKLNGIETETIKEFELSSKTLTEITHSREQVLATLKSNTTSALLKKTLDIYDKEMEDIKNKSKINSLTIELKWRTSEFIFTNLCELSIPILQEAPSPPNLPQQTESEIHQTKPKGREKYYQTDILRYPSEWKQGSGVV